MTSFGARVVKGCSGGAVGSLSFFLAMMSLAAARAAAATTSGTSVGAVTFTTWSGVGAGVGMAVAAVCCEKAPALQSDSKLNTTVREIFIVVTLVIVLYGNLNSFTESQSLSAFRTLPPLNGPPPFEPSSVN